MKALTYGSAIACMQINNNELRVEWKAWDRLDNNESEIRNSRKLHFLSTLIHFLNN